MRDHRTMRLIALAACVWLMLSAAAHAQEVKPLLLSSFEPGGPDWVKGNFRVVAEHASHGRHSALLESSPKGYPGIQILDGAVLREGALDGVEIGTSETFDCGDLVTLSLTDEVDAGIDGLSVHEHGARAAFSLGACLFGALKSEIIAQDI